MVEHDADMREVLGELFIGLGHQTSSVSTGHAGLKALAELDPDVVFVGSGLLDMTECDFARRVRAMFPPGRPTLVAVTGWSNARDYAASFQAGMDLHLVKPVGLQELRAVVGDASEFQGEAAARAAKAARSSRS